MLRLPAEPKYEMPSEDATNETERPSDTKQPIEVAMGLKMSKDNRKGSTMRGTTMASLRSKMCVSFVPQHWYRGKTLTNTKIPS